MYTDMDDFQSNLLVNTRLERRTYLVRYYQADLVESLTTKEFGKSIKKHFDIGSSKVKVQQLGIFPKKILGQQRPITYCTEADWAKVLEICQKLDQLY